MKLKREIVISALNDYQEDTFIEELHVDFSEMSAVELVRNFCLVGLLQLLYPGVYESEIEGLE